MYTFNSKVSAQVEKLKIRHEKFQQLTKSTDTSTNAEFKDLRKSTFCELYGVLIIVPMNNVDIIVC